MSVPTRLARAPALLLLAGLALAACSTTPYQRRAAEEARAAAAETARQASAELYEVREDDRFVVFSDRASYLSYLTTGEVPQGTLRPGAGPHGETALFVLTPEEQALGEKAPVFGLFDGSTSADQFYGEMRRYGRVYVFDDPALMAAVRTHGHPAYSYVRVADGPQGETVVYALDAARQYQRPDDLIAHHAAQAKD